MEEREEFLISLATGQSSLRIGHFLRPSVTSPDGPAFAPPAESVNPTVTSLAGENLPLKVAFAGWKSPTGYWKNWVDRMFSLHNETWKQAGIHNAILSSTCKLHRQDDIIFGFAKRWCPVTNTFVFPWGEATVTLEDIMILGGYSVLGDSTLGPLGDRDVEKSLLDARMDIVRSGLKKASQKAWMEKYMNNGDETEHAAFLAYWLSRFVFASSVDNVIYKNVLPVAVHLPRGNRISLAPLVLASIYKNLNSLKEGLGAARRSEIYQIKLMAPLELVQIWVWERFPNLQPTPRSINPGEPRLFRWHQVKKNVIGDVLSIVDSDESKNQFCWRPYVQSHEFYKEREIWVLVKDGLDADLETFVRWLRVSELVSFDSDYTEQYLPHRVAMQFE
ncbi:Aminotransferase-like [Abeliophyllum distichum]|uniref:Aminotransferase-like n=1 Tax=Abeliophyllum distichum TaxID=126358 RepID=A0ABD1NPY6_9LAMI